MPKSIIADLHIHSTHSDGELSPSLLVDRAAEAGLKVIALTDHDAIAGIPAAIQRGKEKGVEVIPGCELSAYEEDTEIHILGLFIDPAPDSALSRLLTEIRASRPARLLQMAEKLRSLGVKIRDEDILTEVGHSESPGRAHIAAVLVKTNAVASMGEAFSRYIGLNGPGYIAKKRYSPDQIIAGIHGAGGLALVAHPGPFRQSRLPTLMMKYAFDGIEIFHPSHPASDRDLYLRMAHDRNWAVCGGSDYHGPTRKPGIELGSNGLNSEQLTELRNKKPR